MTFEKRNIEFAKNCNLISHILVKDKSKLVSLQNPGQPMGWLGWPVATALIFLWMFLEPAKSAYRSRKSIVSISSPEAIAFELPVLKRRVKSGAI